MRPFAYARPGTLADLPPGTGQADGHLRSTAPTPLTGLTEAAGVVLRDLPLTPERVRRALRAAA